MIRCFYSPDYFFPLPEGHPFPMEKFPQAHAMLERLGVLTDCEWVEPCADAIVSRVHTKDYLRRLRNGTLEPREATVLGLPPGEALYRRSALEVEGTRRAMWHALENGIAANLAGGTHHAFADRGSGFCVLNDVVISIRDLHGSRPGVRVLVFDTDAHQGNGTHALCREDARVYTFSIHVGPNYPSKKEPGDRDCPLPRYASGADYLEALWGAMLEVFETARPDLVFWISGADPHRNDRFGQLQLSLREMADRDEGVVAFFRAKGVPLVVLYGGGYNRQPGHTARLHRNTILAAMGRLRLNQPVDESVG